jgi:hypothetical protein
MYTLTEIEQIVLERAKQISLPLSQLPKFETHTAHTGYVVDLKLDAYHYYHVERGNVSDLKITHDPEELLFWILADATHRMAFEFELKNRIPNQDSRIIAFQEHIRLLVQVGITEKFIEQLKLKYNKLCKGCF